MPTTKSRNSPKWRRGDGAAYSASNFVNFTLVPPFTWVDVVQGIARQLRVHLDLESIPEQLKMQVFRRDEVVFGAADHELDNITANFEGLHWTIEKRPESSIRVLKFAFVKNGGKSLSQFDELAGRLMAEARPRRGANGRLDLAEYEKIATKLDEAGFELLEYAEHSSRKGIEKGSPRGPLAKWNQNNSRKAICTFAQAIASDPLMLCGQIIDFRRAVLRRLSRAEAKWRESHPTA